ncbi:HD domain-containing protein [Geoalkalibacter halelectricus]|uniref:HD domain-containing protein n=1 Tax=Geoalkalibacter halelectricus TaxID=2847045 RepID=UPI00266F86A6|nr:HD domain-containing protein [Geoalkalibacter halelectricus]MDO3380440.1 HD domain-containing protein [Geoalkalibacter halelectricus]
MISLIRRVKLFAEIAHRGQVRKYTGEPYVVHPLRVSFWVASVSNGPEIVAASVLHDTLEDTRTDYADIRDFFGKRVADLVLEVTGVSRPADGNRQARKALDRSALAGASADAQTIKLADLIDNIGSIASHDPRFAKIYMQEKAQLLEVLTKGHPALYAEARRIVDGYFANKAV